MEPLAAPWDELFAHTMDDLHANYTEEAVGALEAFAHKVEALLLLISQQSKTAFSEKVPVWNRQLEYRISHPIGEAKREARDINREVVFIIEDHIEPAYYACTQEAHGSYHYAVHTKAES